MLNNISGRPLLYISMTALALSLVGCGDDGSGGSGTAAGTITPAWESYCVATFTEDYTVYDVFDEPSFTARAGEKYLLSRYDSSPVFGPEIFYLSEAGPVDFEIEVEEGEELPFTSDCEIDNNQTHVGVFKTTTLYRDEALTEEACRLEAGTVATRSFWSSKLVDGSSRDYSVYEISLGDLSSECNGVGTAYVKVPAVEILGVIRTPVPIQSFRGPQ